ncbi:MAG: T9SS type A sorting domain-containing protein [Candidatus Krumholzibacteriaceae bacterium]
MARAIVFVLFFIGAAFVGPASLHASWDYNGIPVCAGEGDQFIPQVCPDGAGGAYVAWMDHRGGGIHVYAQRIDDQGNAVWQLNGLLIGESLSPAYPAHGFGQELKSDDHGNMIIAWDGVLNGVTGVYGQKIDQSGNFLWGAQGVLLSPTVSHQTDIVATLDSDGGIIVAWADARTAAPSLTNIYAQRVDKDGNVLWGPNGILIGSGVSPQTVAQIVTDGAGGAIVAWMQFDSMKGDWDIYGQRVDAGGAALWSAAGMPVCTAPEDQDLWYYTPIVPVPDGKGGAIIAWRDNRTFNSSIYAQRIDRNGYRCWALNGIAISLDNWAAGCVMKPDGMSGAFITWYEAHGGQNDIYAQRVDSSGAAKWDTYGKIICDAPGAQVYPGIETDGAGGVVITWQDARNGNNVVYAQRLAPDGMRLWNFTGAPVCIQASEQTFAEVAYVGNGESIFAWGDKRSGNFDVYANKLDATGHVLGPIATLVTGFWASVRDMAVEVAWGVSQSVDGSRFIVMRSEGPLGSYTDISTLEGTRGNLDYRFTDTACEPGKSYRYRVDLATEAGRETLFETDAVSLPVMPVSLYQNHPNPFNPSTAISYYLPAETSVTLNVYDVSGRLVSRLSDRTREQRGVHTATWDGSDLHGRAVGSGVYIYRLRAGDRTMSRKMILLK